MKATSFLLLTASLLTLPNSGCVSRKKVDAERAFIFNKVAAVAIRINVEGITHPVGFGSGVFLGFRGLVLTNQHVAQPSAIPPGVNYWLAVCLVFDGVASPCLPAEVVTVSEEDDLALLQVRLPDLVPIRIRPDAEAMSEAELVYARLGFSNFLPPSLVYGRYLGSVAEYRIFDLAAMVGSSGGPVFDLQGRLVGLVRAITTDDGRTLAGVISSKTIRKFLFEHGYVFR